MAISKDEGKALRFKKARTYRGKCCYCWEPILVGEEYIEGVGGSRTIKVGVAHKGCYLQPNIVRR